MTDLAERHLARPDALGARRVDVLEVDVEDAPARRPRDLDRVRAAEVDVAGVDAQPDVGRLEQPVDVRPGLDGQAPVGMERGLQAGIGDERFEARRDWRGTSSTRRRSCRPACRTRGAATTGQGRAPRNRSRPAAARHASRTRAPPRSGPGGRGGPARTRRRCSCRTGRGTPEARPDRSAGSRRARARSRDRPLSTISRRTRSRSIR